MLDEEGLDLAAGLDGTRGTSDCIISADSTSQDLCDGDLHARFLEVERSHELVSECARLEVLCASGIVSSWRHDCEADTLGAHLHGGDTD